MCHFRGDSNLLNGRVVPLQEFRFSFENKTRLDSWNSSKYFGMFEQEIDIATIQPHLLFALHQCLNKEIQNLSVQ